MEEKNYTLRELTEVAFQIIVKAGEGKSFAMSSITFAKEGESQKAQKCLEEAEAKLIEAEKEHFQLIRDEASGNRIQVPLILMHAEDQLMSTQATIAMAKELNELRQELSDYRRKDK